MPSGSTSASPGSAASSGEASRISQVGLSEARVFEEKIQAYGDSRLFALNLIGEHFAHSQQPLVPERLLISGGAEGNAAQGHGLLGQLLTLLLADKTGFGVGAHGPARIPAEQPAAENSQPEA